MNCLAVIDTNVLISALLSSKDDAATVQVIEKVLMGEITPVYSHSIMDEYREVLHRKKFHFSNILLDYLLASIEYYGILLRPSKHDFILPDMKDVPFYEVVMEKKDDGAFLVTGNTKHFPKKPFIVTPRELIDILKSNS